MTVSHEERLARVALASVAEPGSMKVHAALQELPAPEVWAALKAGEPLGQIGRQALANLQVRVHDCRPERDLERLERCGGRVLCPGDPEWPSGLDWPPDTMSGEIQQMAPPWALFVRGPHDLPVASAGSVAIVGSRAATAYGLHVATEMAFALAEAGVTVVSGGAYGIDGAAHRGALNAQAAPTIAVLACGVDVTYPRGHDRLFGQIAETGLLVSEVPPGAHVTRVRFLVRNRLVAALATGTVVVEAALRSGSLSTSGRAWELGRTVMAVPGPVTSSLTGGTHELIRNKKATLVTCAAEVLELVSPMGQHLLTPAKGPVHPRDGLKEAARRVLDAVPVRSAIGVARIAQGAGVSALVVQQVLPALLVAGLVEQRDGGWRLTTLGASRG